MRGGDVVREENVRALFKNGARRIDASGLSIFREPGLSLATSADVLVSLRDTSAFRTRTQHMHDRVLPANVTVNKVTSILIDMLIHDRPVPQNPPVR